MLIPDIFFTTSPLGPAFLLLGALGASTSYTKIPVRLWPILALSYLAFLLTINMASTSWRLSYSTPGGEVTLLTWLAVCENECHYAIYIE